LKIKIKNLDTFMQRLEDYGGINVEFDYESLEAQKSNHLGTILELLLLGGIGYWLYLSYGFYKKNVKAGKGLNLGGDMFGFGKIKKVGLDGEFSKVKFKDVAG
jgi:ATP-dependent Zn protease